MLAGRKTEDLVLWVKNDVPDGFFLDTDNEEVAAAYTDVMLWVQRRPLNFDYAKAKFATGADGSLVAYARIHGAVIVTNEQPAPESKREIKLPDVCEEFGVTYVNTFAALKDLSARFVMEAAHSCPATPKPRSNRPTRDSRAPARGESFDSRGCRMRRGGRNSNNRLVSPHLEADNDIVWRTATEHVPALEAAPAHERDKCHGGQGE